MRRKEKNRIKKELKLIYDAPLPAEREEFLRGLGEPGISLGEFLWIQAGYIRKWNYVVSVLIFFVLCRLLWQAGKVNMQVLWAVSACVPFFAMVTVTEAKRSVRCGMEELELAAPFSFKTIMLARMGILGLLNGGLMLLCLPVAWHFGLNQGMYAGIFMLAPYLAAGFLNLLIARKVPGRENMYFCFGATVLVSGLFAAAGFSGLSPETLAAEISWGPILAVLVLLVGNEFYKTVKQSEEYVWNLS